MKKKPKAECYLGLGHIWAGLYDHSKGGRLKGRYCKRCNKQDSEVIF